MKMNEKYKKHQEAISTLSITELIRAVDYIHCTNDLLGDNEVTDDTEAILEPLEKVIAKCDASKVCNRCGLPLYFSGLPNYDYVCVECDENF